MQRWGYRRFPQDPEELLGPRSPHHKAPEALLPRLRFLIAEIRVSLSSLVSIATLWLLWENG